jgi:hypothetical protein
VFSFFLIINEDSHKMFIRGNMTLLSQMRRTKNPLDIAGPISERGAFKRPEIAPSSVIPSVVVEPSNVMMESSVSSKSLHQLDDAIPDMMITLHGRNGGGDGEAALGPIETIHHHNNGIVSATGNDYAAKATAGVAVVSPTTNFSDVFYMDDSCRSGKVVYESNGPLPFCDFGKIFGRMNHFWNDVSWSIGHLTCFPHLCYFL